MKNLSLNTDGIDTTDRKLVEEIVDEDIRQFDSWFQERVKSGRLVPSERAAIKTYLFYKFFGSDHASTSG